MSKKIFNSASLKPFIPFEGLKGDEVVERKGLQSKLTIGEDEERTIICNITTDSLDADGDIIVGTGADLNRYMKNPVVLVNHSHKVEDIIGRATELSVSKQGIMARIVLATTQKASDVWELVKGKFLNTNSIGFIVKSAIVKGTKDYANFISANPEYSAANRIITGFELLENSLVAIPANPEALVLAVSNKSIALSDNMIKELNIEESKEESKEVSITDILEEVKKEVCDGTMLPVEPPVELKELKEVKEAKEDDLKDATDITIDITERPYPNEHAARLNNPDKYVRFRRVNNKLGEGIDVIYGITSDGKTEIQAIRFKKDKFTAEEARQWLKDHNIKPISFEPAAEPKYIKVLRIGFDIESIAKEELKISKMLKKGKVI